jgi:hypothetical protein
MAKSSVRHPKITPMRAFELLRELDRNHGRVGAATSNAEDRAREALASHVRAELTKRRR